MSIAASWRASGETDNRAVPDLRNETGRGPGEGVTLYTAPATPAPASTIKDSR